MAPAHSVSDAQQVQRQVQVVSLTKYIPYPEVAHAGGQYLLAHDRALSLLTETVQFAPDTTHNRVARTHVAVDAPPAHLLTEAQVQGPLFRWWQLESVWAGSSIYWPVRRLFQSERAPWAELAAADIIELQWSEMIALAPSIRRRLPHATIVGVAHDVVTQRWQRQAARTTGLRKWITALAAKRSTQREAASFDALDALIVFSKKDAELAATLAPRVRTEVVFPGLGPSSPLPRTPVKNEPVVLFTGAMNRAENAHAVSWFLDTIWPTVLSAVPTATFVVAGAHPSAQLAQRISSASRAELTGFVDSLEPYYASASVCVVPLREGAGVKFKTVDAMLRGVPTVTTTVGAEGIDAPQLFAAITDDPHTFADAVIHQLQEPNLALAQRSQQWADSIYGVAAFTERITGLYGSLAHK